MKVCMIGNSHLIAIKEGIEEDNCFGADGPIYVFAPGSELTFNIADSHLTPTAPRARIMLADGRSASSVDLSLFDAFIVINSGMSAVQALRVHSVLRSFRRMTHGTRLVSGAVLTASLCGLLLESKACEIARQIRAAVAAPIYLVSLPMPPNKVTTLRLETTSQKRVFDNWKGMFEEELGLELYQRYVAAAHLAAAEVGAIFVEQPRETRGPLFTLDQYQAKHKAQFEQRGGEAKAEDLSHMNSAYGRLVARDIHRAHYSGAKEEAVST